MAKTRGGRQSRQCTYGLPPETAGGAVSLRLLDRRGCVLEGEYAILAYTDTLLWVQVSWGSIRFRGEALQISEMSAGALAFYGTLHGIEYSV